MEPMMRYTRGYREFTTGNWTIRCSSGTPERLVLIFFLTYLLDSYSEGITPTERERDLSKYSYKCYWASIFCPYLAIFNFVRD